MRTSRSTWWQWPGSGAATAILLIGMTSAQRPHAPTTDERLNTCSACRFLAIISKRRSRNLAAPVRSSKSHSEGTMPYRHNEDLPSPVRNPLPPHAQDIYLAAFNHAFASHQGDP